MHLTIVVMRDWGPGLNSIYWFATRFERCAGPSSRGAGRGVIARGHFRWATGKQSAEVTTQSARGRQLIVGSGRRPACAQGASERLLGDGPRDQQQDVSGAEGYSSGVAVQTVALYVARYDLDYPSLSGPVGHLIRCTLQRCNTIISSIGKMTVLLTAVCTI